MTRNDISPVVLGRDAFLKADIHDGIDIHTINHFGTCPPSYAPLWTWDRYGHSPAPSAPAADAGGVCNDHIDPVANHDPTSYKDPQPLCWADRPHQTE